ncbi:7,8-didemethyl-8-hydroxy-5-deazariboflavin synthase subunit CofG [Thermodesulfobacteriota bacterium]
MRFLDHLQALDFVRSREPSALAERAKRIRQDRFGRVVTYAKNITLDLSHACRNACAYCCFRLREEPSGREAPPPEAVLLPDGIINDRIARAAATGCTEVLITSGEQPDGHPLVRRELGRRGFDSYAGFVADVCRRCLDAGVLPHTNIGIVSAEDFELIRPLNASMGLMLETTRQDLCAGEGPHLNSPGKIPAERLGFLELAGRRHVPFTTGILVGIGESIEDRVESFVAINRLQDAYGHIQEVIIQNFVPKPDTRFAAAAPTTMQELLDTVIIGRNLLSPEISVQVPPNLIAGAEAEFLHAGVNDFGGISSLMGDVINPFQPWPDVVRFAALCEAEGYRLQERLPIYEGYFDHEQFVPPRIREVSRALLPGQSLREVTR